MEELRLIKENRLKGLNNLYVGKLFGKLTVISILGIKKKRTVVSAKCECGKIKDFFLYNLLRCHTKSCGCLVSGVMAGNFKHGEATRAGRSLEHNSWTRMKTSVLSKSENVIKKYKNLRKYGVSICGEWLDNNNGYQNFLKDMGRKPSNKHRLERINKREGFNANNCRWVIRGYDEFKLNSGI